jgi:hypothetical protein
MQSEFATSPHEAANDLVDHWFRALDQRQLRVGVRDWIVQVTGIYIDADHVWIQIADGFRRGASTVLHVSSTTSVEDAVEALAARACKVSRSHPLVVDLVVESPRTPAPASLITPG